MKKEMKPYPVLEFSAGVPLGQLSSVPVKMGKENAILIVFSEDPSIDPWEEIFSFPKHTQKMALFTLKGKEIWRKEFPNVVPGVWFFPVFPFDLDGDGYEEIFCVNNTDPQKPLAISKFVMERLDPRTGEKTGEWKWTCPTHNQALSHKFRFFILGGYVKDSPVLVTAQGTYGQMLLQAWNADMSSRWKLDFPDDSRGSRGSHTTAILDLNADGKDKFMWGERCIEFDDGNQVFIADRDTWGDHSDIVQPVFNNKDQRWYFYTCREKGDDGNGPRVVMFDDHGQRVWTDHIRGHMHWGWVANVGKNGEQIAMATRIAGSWTSAKRQYDCWTYEAYTGEKIEVPINPAVLFHGSPVDFNGDGIHEIYYEGIIYDNLGNKCGSLGANVSAVTFYKFTDHPGEQVLVYRSDGTVQVWADRNARDTEKTLKRYQSDFYQRNIKLSASGYNNLLTLTMF